MLRELSLFCTKGSQHGQCSVRGRPEQSLTSAFLLHLFTIIEAIAFCGQRRRGMIIGASPRTAWKRLAVEGSLDRCRRSRAVLLIARRVRGNDPDEPRPCARRNLLGPPVIFHDELQAGPIPFFQDGVCLDEALNPDVGVAGAPRPTQPRPVALAQHGAGWTARGNRASAFLFSSAISASFFSILAPSPFAAIAAAGSRARSSRVLVFFILL